MLVAVVELRVVELVAVVPVVLSQTLQSTGHPSRNSADSLQNKVIFSGNVTAVLAHDKRSLAPLQSGVVVVVTVVAVRVVSVVVLAVVLVSVDVVCVVDVSVVMVVTGD